MVWISIQYWCVNITLAKQAKAELANILNACLQGVGELVLNTEIYGTHFRILQVVGDRPYATERASRIRSKRRQQSGAGKIGESGQCRGPCGSGAIDGYRVQRCAVKVQ